ncbi:MAG: Inner membrane transport protein YdhP [Paracidovorax wautersii]|uniref:Inner membrane transport protein YdhP n=1 Tax=Paracidovorax wautersii TaxID=1177982 RepID=A0A7V8FKM2_9BURK|nr:MAG: Inner membrane transport protein YdhP [Paracidovorax wautersii]
MPANEQATTTIEQEAQRESVAVRAILAMAVGGFAIGTGEFVIMGLLPEMAQSLAITIPQAGHAISAYALGVVIGAPVLAIACARWPRRRLLIALMLLFSIGNFASALAPGYLSLNALRFLAGLPHGTYFGVAALVAATLAPPGQRARAVGWLMLGLTTATVAGVPLAAWLGQHLGWRYAFVLVGALALLAAYLVRHWVPRMPADQHASPLRELGGLRRKQLWLTLGIGAIGMGGLFSVYSYVKPTLMEVAGMPLGGIPLVLALFGCGMVAGNLVGAPLADRSIKRTMAGLLVWAFVVLLAFAFTAQSVWLACLNIFLIGTVVAMGPVLQIRLMDMAGEAQTLAAALNHSAFNTANALGAWLGGLTIAAGLGWTSTAWVGAALAVAGMGMFAWSMAVDRKAA